MVIAPGFYLFPFRTEKSSPVAPMVLDGTAMQCGRVGGRLLLRSEGRVSSEEEIRSSFFCAYMMLLMAACSAIVCSFLFIFYLRIYCYMV